MFSRRGTLLVGAVIGCLLLSACGQEASTRSTASTCQNIATTEAAVSAHARGLGSSAADGLALVYRNDCRALARTAHLSRRLTEGEARRLALGFGSEVAAATRSSTSTVTRPNAARSAQTSENVVVEKCPSTYGITGRHPVPSMLPSSIPAADGLMFYANTALAVLAPTGWSCRGTVGADGSAELTVGSGDGSERITASEGSACVTCNATLACPLIPAATKALPAGVTCPSQPPAAEQISRINTTSVAFEDPPYVHGTGTPSGGPNPANGVVLYLGQPPEASKETCTLPASQHSICTDSLNAFIGRYQTSGRTSRPPRPRRIP